MKTIKRTRLSELMAEVIRQLSARFQPLPLDIKKRVETLIEQVSGGSAGSIHTSPLRSWIYYAYIDRLPDVTDTDVCCLTLTCCSFSVRRYLTGLHGARSCRTRRVQFQGLDG